MVIIIKRFLWLLPCIAILFSLVPVNASAVSSYEIDIVNGLGTLDIDVSYGLYGYSLRASYGEVMAEGRLNLSADGYYEIFGEDSFSLYYLLVYVAGDGLYVYTYRNGTFVDDFEGTLILELLPPTASERIVLFWEDMSDVLIDGINRFQELFFVNQYGSIELTNLGVILTLFGAVPFSIVAVLVIASFFRFRK